MKVYKPLDLSLLHRVFEWDFEQQFVVTTLLGFKLDSGESILEPDLWTFLGDELGKDVAFDTGMPKPNAEALIFGSYYSPGDKPVTADRVGFSVGLISKELSVIGDRYWRPLIGPTPPEPFTQMPISYDYAFGGDGYEMNPTGKGAVEITLDTGETVTPLPNIEHPDKLVTSASDMPEPQGFGPLDISWKQRTGKMGTYDDKWINERAPAYPADLDWTHFNSAISDQWLDGFFNGGESYELANMHPEQTNIKGKLPDYCTRCYIERLVNEKEVFEEIAMHMDTVCFFPDKNTGVLIFRGMAKIEQDDASDVGKIVVAYESPTDKPRDELHFRNVIANRVDPETKLKYLLTTKDMIPEGVVCGYARLLAASGDGPELAMLANQQEKSRIENEKAEALIEEKKKQIEEMLVKAGVDPKETMQKIDASKDQPHNPDIQKILDAMNQISPGLADGKKELDFEKLDISKIDDVKRLLEEYAENEKIKAKELLKEKIHELKAIDGTADKVKEMQTALERMDMPPPLPRPEIEPAIKKLKDELVSAKQLREKLISDGVDPSKIPVIEIDIDKVETDLRDAGERLKDTYRGGAHMMEAGTPPHFNTMDTVLQSFKEKLQAGGDLSNGDYAGLDLSEMKLAGVNLSGAYLEDVNLSNVDLTNANLSNAILSRANLSEADFTGSDLTNANFGAANLSGAILHQCKTTGLVLARAILDQCQITDCDLSSMVFFETQPGRVNFSGTVMPKAVFLEQDINGATFDNANLTSNVFLNCELKNSSFKSATLEETTFVGVDVSNSDFDSANMKNARFVSKSNLSSSKFINATLDKVNFRDADMQKADLSSSSINSTDFGEANLQKAVFNRASGIWPQFIKSDLGLADLSNACFYEGSMLKARLTSADLRNSNCYGVEFMSATVGDTDFSGTILDMTKLKDWRPS